MTQLYTVEEVDYEINVLRSKLRLLVVRKLKLLEGEKTCIVCGMTNEYHEGSLGMGPLIDIRVIIADGEEGHADETRYFCNDDMITFTKLLNVWGFEPTGEFVDRGICFLDNS